MIKRHVTILVVDDEEAFRAGLELNLRKEGYQVAAVASAAEALDLISRTSVDLIITDIRMPGMDGVELMKQIKIQAGLPVILMTGFSELIETLQGHLGGADAFLAKPFQRDNLIETVEATLGARDQLKLLKDADFSKVYILDFVSGRHIRYDIYIRLSQDRFVKVAHQGIDLPLERLRAYQAKGVTHLYLKNADFRRYVGFATLLASEASHSQQVSPETKLKFVSHASQLISEQLASSQLDPEQFENARTLVEATVQLIADEPDLLNLIDALNRHADHLFAHSLGVSLYGVMLAREMGWVSPANLFKIAIGGLLHDIGKKEVPAAILKKPRFHWTPAEVKEYESHPEKGTELIRSISGLAEDVLKIIEAHHEDCEGQGFPSRLREAHIHPLARLVAVANEFSRLILKSPDGEPLPLDKAVQKLWKQHRLGLDHRFFEALTRICKVEMASLH